MDDFEKLARCESAGEVRRMIAGLGLALVPATEIERLQAVNEQDRTAVAAGLQSIFRAIRGREWLRLGRGSYEWNDDRWKDEFGAALDEIWDALDPLRQIAGNLKDCPATQAAVDAARAAMSLKEREPG